MNYYQLLVLIKAIKAGEPLDAFFTPQFLAKDPLTREGIPFSESEFRSFLASFVKAVEVGDIEIPLSEIDLVQLEKIKKS